MPSFKYEIHAHTSETSRCSEITGRKLVKYYQQCGFSGLCVTDHFLNGNTTVPPDLTWSEQIDLFCRGYEKALEEGKKTGFKVFFGWEYSFRGTDLLTYGLDKKWLLEHPDLLDYSITEYCELVHESGGLLVHAHPFRESDYIEMIRLLPRRVDAVEIINTQRKNFVNDRAREYAVNYELLKIAGSDTHNSGSEKLAGIKTEQPLKKIDDLTTAILNNNYKNFVIQN